MSIKLFLIAVPVFFTIDIFWLALIARKFYKDQIGFLMKPEINWYAAIIFYLLFIAGLVIFVIEPAVERQSWINALVFGALFGLVTYATYDLTNLASMKGWPLLVTVVDMVWGTFLASSVSVITFFIAKGIY